MGATPRAPLCGRGNVLANLRSARALHVLLLVEMDKEEISSMVACATVLPPTNSLSLAVQGAGFASGALASAWLGKGRGAGSLTTSSMPWCMEPIMSACKSEASDCKASTALRARL